MFGTTVSSGGTNKPLLRAIASRPGMQMIGILSRWAFNDLVSGDAEMLDLFTRIELDEPDEVSADEMADQKPGPKARLLESR